MPIVNTVEDLVRLLRENEEFRAAARRELLTGQERRETDRPLVEFDGTVVAQKVLSAVIRTGESYAVAHVVDVLQGGRSSTVLELGHDRLSVFGIEREMDRDDLLAIVDQLVERELAARTSRTHPALYVTPRGRAFLKDRETITLLRAAGDPPLQESEDPEYDADLYEKLRVLRKSLANEREVPAYIVATNAVLRKMASSLPLDHASLSSIEGVGENRLREYGDLFISAVAEHVGVTLDRAPALSPPAESLADSGTLAATQCEASADPVIRAQVPAEKFLSRLVGRPVYVRSQDPETRRSLEDAVAGAVATFREREAHIVTRRLGLEDGHESTLQKIGLGLGVSRERVRQIEARALRKLRHPSRRRPLEPFIEDDTPPDP